LKTLAGCDIGPRFDPCGVAQAIALRLETTQGAVLPRRRIVTGDNDVDD
jgi:hypothetical protein